VAPGSQAQAAVELISTGLEQSGTDPAKYPLALTLRRTSPEGSPSARFEGWLAVLERRPARPAESVAQSVPASTGSPPPAVPAPSSAPAADPTPPAPAVVPAPLPQPAGLLKAPGPARANPAALATPSPDAKPASACTGPSPTCPGGG